MTPKEILQWYWAGDKYPNVYVLGAFAKRVTLYSQQMRALNLVFAMVREGIIKKGREVVVIGAGAAGLTAAAGAAKHGARVVLLEKYGSIMESLRGNRQRWIHPRIYDWPALGSRDQVAALPLLNWSAGYAEQVVEQIEGEWEHLVTRYSIDVHLGEEASIANDSGQVKLKWADEQRDNAIIILAVGFGFEPDNYPFYYSYWTEDKIDGGFNRSMDGETWLVSGYGDGALTDVMRLCLRNFRHAKITELFSTVGGNEDLERQLKKLVSRPNMTAEDLTRSFRDLPLLSMARKLERNRRNLNICLNGRDAFPYGPNSSALNRLVVCVLEQMAKLEPDKGKPKFEIVAGGTILLKDFTRKDGKFYIKLGGHDREFDGVVLRHGPEERTPEDPFACIWQACSDLKENWKVNEAGRTQVREWSDNFFGPEWSPDGGRSGEKLTGYMTSALALGVSAGALNVAKILRDDGTATLKYEIKDLAVTAPGVKLAGMRFYYRAEMGHVGQPQLDENALLQGIRWQEAPPSPQLSDAENAKDRARRLEGVVEFHPPREQKDPPFSFSLSAMVLRADALTGWEYRQMYPEDSSTDVDGDHFPEPMEYLSRVVWFPVGTMHLSITLPRNVPGPVLPSLFKLDETSQIESRHVIEAGLLQMYPPEEKWKLHSKAWSRDKSCPDLLLRQGQFRSHSMTSELTVACPSVGHCYSVEWKLPERPVNSDEGNMEDEARDFRQWLLNYREKRRRNEGEPGIRSLLIKLHRDITAMFEKFPDPGENVVLSLLTYDEKHRCLRFVDGILNGGNPTDEMWDFTLPFGSGASGVAFMQQNNDPLVYLAARTPEEEEERKGRPEPYLKLTNMQHSYLLAVPIDHPRYRYMAPLVFEAARQRLAVVDIGTDSKKSKLLQLVPPPPPNESEQRLEREARMRKTGEVVLLCRDFGRDLAALKIPSARER